MKMKYTLTALLVSCGAAQAANLLTPGDFIIGIGVPVPDSNYPGGEPPSAVIDGDAGTKYLNFGVENSGFIVTPGSSVARSAVFTTANDAEERDPATVSIYGTNDPISSVDNGQANGGETWSLITTGAASLPLARGAVSAALNFSNLASFSSYRVSFDTVKDAGAANSMQLAEFQLFTGLGGGGSSILGPANSIIAFDTDAPTSISSFPGNESPVQAIDGNTGTKYLNFGGPNAGFIVTPGGGPSIVTEFTMTTANDTPDRDPTTYNLYGTNDAITSAENSVGSDENWVLIQSGTLTPPGAYFTDYAPEAVANGTAYSSYRFDVTGNGGDGLIQFSEFQMDGTFVPEPSSAMLLLLGMIPVMRRRR